MSDPNEAPADRHGIERLRWLQRSWIWPENANKPAADYKVYHLLDQKEVEVECTAALIEELHDALRSLARVAENL